jgi:hypothetical protein
VAAYNPYSLSFLASSTLFCDPSLKTREVFTKIGSVRAPIPVSFQPPHPGEAARGRSTDSLPQISPRSEGSGLEAEILGQSYPILHTVLLSPVADRSPFPQALLFWITAIREIQRATAAHAIWQGHTCFTGGNEAPSTERISVLVVLCDFSYISGLTWLLSYIHLDIRLPVCLCGLTSQVTRIHHTRYCSSVHSR